VVPARCFEEREKNADGVDTIEENIVNSSRPS